MARLHRNMRQEFEQISILGAGLLGGSLGIDSKSLYPGTRVVAWSRRSETRKKCLQTDWCDAVFDTPAEACRGADLIILCTTVEHIPLLMEEIAEVCEPDTLITDVGSTKHAICQKGHEVFSSERNGTFIGSHPMAGSEKTGLDAARADLFRDQSCILTPWQEVPESKNAPYQKLKNFWEALGMRVFSMNPADHDQLVGKISHLPHAVATSLMHAVARSPELWISCAGRGLKDTTRIAAGDPLLWGSIFRENKEAVISSLALFQEEINTFLTLLKNNDPVPLEEYLRTGEELRNKLS